MEASETASTIPEVFYDVLSILMPGLYFLIAVYFAEKEAIEALTKGGVINPTLTAVIVAYLLGFLLYAISSLIVAKPFTWFLGQPAHFLLLGDPTGKYLKRHQRFFFGTPATPEHLRRNVERGLRHLQGDPGFTITTININEVYELSRNYVMERSARRAVSIRKEQAYGEMCRAIIVISVLLLIALPVLRLSLGVPKSGFLIQLIVHAVFLLAFSFRYGQARLIGPYQIYATFSIMMPGRVETTAPETP